MDKLEKYLLKTLNANKNSDVKIRKETLNNQIISIIYLSSLIDNELFVLLIDSLKNPSYLMSPNVSIEKNYRKIIDSILEGNVVLILEEKCLICDLKKYPTRSISSPEVEKSVRGSKDSFNESIAINIALIRRRIKSENLILETFSLSKESKMMICLAYMNNLNNKKDILEIKKRIKKVNLSSLIMADKALEEALFKQKKQIFPLVRYTERPDVASINIIRGKIVILVDTSSNAIILPITIFDLFKNVEEYKQNYIIGSFTKTLRLLGSLISMFLVPLFILFTIEDGYDNGVIPLYNLELTNPLLIQISIVSLVLEIIRIAIVHTPNALTSALSLLAAIVLSEISISLGLFSQEILLVTSLAITCNFATPSYELSLANRFISLCLVFITCIFKVKGFLIACLILFLYLVSIKMMNYPYLYPICPFDFEMFKNLFIRQDNDKKK